MSDDARKPDETEKPEDLKKPVGGESDWEKEALRDMKRRQEAVDQRQAGPTDQDGLEQQPAEEGTKIHVDADWKREAQAEKERLAREAREARPAGAMRLPEPAFATLVQMLATQAAIFMSDERDPQTGQSYQNLDLAKHHVDLLAMLEEKTKGNLTPEEKRLLSTMLYELRMAYVQAAS